MKFFEDIAAGERFEVGRHTFDAEGIKAFARLYDPQPFHVDEAAAVRSHFGSLVASGWQTAAVWMRLMVEHQRLEDAALRARGEPVAEMGPSPGFRELKWLKPVYPGDQLSLRHTILESRALRKRPEIGMVRSRWELFNQWGDKVLEMDGYGFFGRRAPASAEELARPDAQGGGA
jgi:acyl dehydratase